MPYENSFAALSHPIRQQIIAALQRNEVSVGDLTGRIDASQPVISQHLKVLRDAGLIKVRPDGVKRIYALEPEKLEALRAYLAAEWATALGKIEDKPNA